MADSLKEQFSAGGSVQQMLLIVFSRILRQRKYHDPQLFFNHEIHGVPVSIINWRNPFVDPCIGNAIGGAATAAGLGYVRLVQMVFKLLHDEAHHFVERYGIVIGKSVAGKADTYAIASPNHHSAPLQAKGQGWDRATILQMIEAADELCKDLADLPAHSIVSFRLDYSKACPRGYQAPHFGRSPYGTLRPSDKLDADDQPPPPDRALSGAGDTAPRLSMQSLLRRRSEPAARPPAPVRPRAQSRGISLIATKTDTSAGSPCPPRQQSRDATEERQPDARTRQEALLGGGDAVVRGVKEALKEGKKKDKEQDSGEEVDVEVVEVDEEEEDEQEEVSGDERSGESSEEEDEEQEEGNEDEDEEEGDDDDEEDEEDEEENMEVETARQEESQQSATRKRRSNEEEADDNKSRRLTFTMADVTAAFREESRNDVSMLNASQHAHLLKSSDEDGDSRRLTSSDDAGAEDKTRDSDEGSDWNENDAFIN